MKEAEEVWQWGEVRGGAIRREWNVPEASEGSVSGRGENSVAGCSWLVREGEDQELAIGFHDAEVSVTLRSKVLGKRRWERRETLIVGV